MYSERDMTEINGRIRRCWLALAPVLAILVGAWVYALAARLKWLAMLAGPLFVVAFIYGFIARLWPNLRYRRFLEDMESGLSRDVRGVIIAISETPEPQDGAMVLPVRLLLAPDGDDDSAKRGSALAQRIGLESGEDTREERILYLNASKRDMMPEPGASVTLHCFGRHIRSMETNGV